MSALQVQGPGRGQAKMRWTAADFSALVQHLPTLKAHKHDDDLVIVRAVVENHLAICFMCPRLFRSAASRSSLSI